MNNNLTQNKQMMLGLTLIIVAVIIAITPNSTKAQTAVVTSAEVTTSNSNETDLAALLATLQSLMKQVEALQKQLAEVRGDIKEVRTELRDGLREGMTHDDIRKIQELLATDPTIYPQGLTTGYFGPLTREALIRFQTRHELRTTGEIDEETKAVILEYFKERTGNKQIPLGLLRAPGIEKKIRERLMKNEDGIISVDCTEPYGSGFLCRYGDDKKNNEDKDKEDEDEDKDESEEENDSDTDNDTDTDAEEEIEAAAQAIDELEEGIKNTNNRNLRREADQKLQQAKNELSKARGEFRSGKEEVARDRALRAQRIATEALRKLKNN